MTTKWIGKTGKVFAKRESVVSLDEVKKWLGEEHYVESDPSEAHSVIERFWVFDVGGDIALCFQYFDPIEKLIIGVNKDTKIHTKLLEKFIGFRTTQVEGILWE